MAIRSFFVLHDKTYTHKQTFEGGYSARIRSVCTLRYYIRFLIIDKCRRTGRSDISRKREFPMIKTVRKRNIERGEGLFDETIFHKNVAISYK